MDGADPCGVTVTEPEFVPTEPDVAGPCVTVIGIPPEFAWNSGAAKLMLNTLPTAALALTSQRRANSFPSDAGMLIGASREKVLVPVMVGTELTPVVRLAPLVEIRTQLESPSDEPLPEVVTEIGTDVRVTGAVERVASSVIMASIAPLRPAGTCFTKSTVTESIAPEVDVPTAVLDPKAGETEDV